AAAALGVELQPIEVRSPEDFVDAFAAIGRGRFDAVSTSSGALVVGQEDRIAEFIASTHVPWMSTGNRSTVERGALMSYDIDEVETFTRVASYVDRIVKGADPAVLPIEKPSKFVLVINLRTAKTLGLTIPKSVLAQATEVIQ